MLMFRKLRVKSMDEKLYQEFKVSRNNNHICIIGIFQFGDQAGGQELEAFPELATSILRTGYGDGSKGSIQVERMPLSFMWTYGELQDNLMTQFIISRLPCMLSTQTNDITAYDMVKFH